MLLDYLKLGVVNLRKRRLRSWLTMLGIFIGVAAVVALIGLGDGLKLAVTSQFGISSTEVLSVQAGGFTGAGPPGTGVVNPLTQDDVKAIENINSVDFAIPRILEQGKLEFNDRLIFGFAMSMPDGEKRKYANDVLEFETVEGRLLRDGDNDKVVLGYNFYDNKVGLEKAVHTGDSVLIQDKEFEVIGISKKKGSFIFDNIVMMNEEPLKKLFNRGDTVSVIAVKAKDSSYLEQTKSDVEKVLRKRRDVKVGEEDFLVQTPQSALETVNQVLSGVQIFIVIVASISIIVGSIGIVNTMLTAVLERRTQIGTMKAIGAKNSDIFLLFFIESGLLGLIGGFVGVLFGTIISYFGTIGISNFIGSSISPGINFVLIIFTLMGSFIIGCIAGIIPAMRAAKQNPVDAMRG